MTTTSTSSTEEPKLDSKEFHNFKLIKLERYNHNTKLFTFRVPGCGNLPVSSLLQAQAYIEKDGKEVQRPYTPLSALVTDEVRLLVKVYPEGKVSQAFDKLKEGDTFQFRGPFLKLPYKANMKKALYLLAGGTGITPMLQIINTIIANPEDKTQVTLFFANQTEEDILLRKEIDAIAAEHKNITVHYSVDKPSSDWKGLSGFVTKETLQKILPGAEHESILIFVCGPGGFYNCLSGPKDFTSSPPGQGELAGLLKDLNYKAEQVYKL